MTTLSRKEMNKNAVAMQAGVRALMSETGSIDNSEYMTIQNTKDKLIKKTDVVIISHAKSGAGKIDLLLKRAEGCTKAEMAECRGAVDAHIAALRKKGANIVCEKGRYYYRPVYNVTSTIIPTETV